MINHPRSRRAFLGATLLAGAVCVAASRGSAQETEPPISESSVDMPAPLEEVRPSGPPSFLKMVLLDTGHVLTSPFRWRGREWLLFSASTAAVAALSLTDQSLSDSAREHGSTLGFFGDTLEGLGDARSFVLLGGFYLAGAIGHDSKTKNVFFDGLSASLIASGIITPVVSSLVGRERPTEGQGAYAFHPFEGRSFPSGHTTQAFAVASVIATSYDQLWVKVTAYGAAAVTAYVRVQRGKHFPTDVVVGAAIGTLVGRSVVHFNRGLRSGEKEPESAGARLTILPVLGGGTFGVSASLDF
jgi:membrane-associated phospholipid phosphatase